MMAQPMVTRTQRRIEKKQAWLIIALVLAVSATSFSLGVMVGRRGLELPGMGGSVQEVRLPIAATIPPPPQEPVSQEKQKLTFYDNLPQGSQAPLGSGINLPPEPKETKAAVVSGAVEPVRDVPEKAVVKVAAPAVAAVATQDSFVVQVASFRTEEDAKKLIGRLQKGQIAAFVEQADLGDKGVWYRVLSGPYTDRPAAERVADQLKLKERLSALVRRR